MTKKTENLFYVFSPHGAKRPEPLASPKNLVGHCGPHNLTRTLFFLIKPAVFNLFEELQKDLIIPDNLFT